VGQTFCAAGASCTADGRCIGSGTGGSAGDGVGGSAANGAAAGSGVGGSAASGVGGSAASGALTGDACAPIDVPFGGQTPTVLLLVDRSGSMDENFGGGTRWSVLYDALMNQNDGVVWSLQSQVRFGLTLYTGGDTCPELNEVPIALNNYGAIDAEYGSAGPGGDTPTAESIAAAAATLGSFSEPGPKYILLVTDGLPDTCANPDAHDAQSQAGSVAAARAAYADGISLIPMGLSDDIATQGAGPGHLQDLANAGAGLPAGGPNNAPYYVASDDPAQLSAQFGSIVGGIRTCFFDLRATIEPAQAGLGTVTLDGDELVYEDPNGWRLSNPQQVEILGTACDRILSSADRLSIVFPCGTVSIF
jgi:hypothetical protein